MSIASGICYTTPGNPKLVLCDNLFRRMEGQRQAGHKRTYGRFTLILWQKPIKSYEYPTIDNKM